MGSKETETVSGNLWVGNLASDVTDSDLTNLFGKHGAVDTITSYAARSYAFIYFKRAEDAKAAKNALQGAVVHGNAIKIEFARPAKPCKSLWVSGINPSVSKEKLEEEFLKFGKIEDFKFLQDRNAAYVDYHKLEDASQALKSMNGKQIGGDRIRVDFLRSHSSRREQWPDFRDTVEEQFLRRSMGLSGSPWKPHDLIKNYPELTHSGSIGQLDSQSFGGLKGDGQPSNVLWVGYPSSVHIDQQMLHNAMILFGEIEKIRSFPSRHYAFVEFRSVDEARRAKEGLQGRLFNDPRISITFSNSELAPGKDYAGFYPGIKGSIPEILTKEFPFWAAQMDNFSPNQSIVPNNFPGLLPPNGILGPNLSGKRLGHQGQLNDSTVLHRLADTNNKPFIGIPNWRISSPCGPGVLPTSLGMKLSIRPLPSEWEVFDGNQIQRETKRSRINDVLPVFDSSSHLKKIEDRGLALDQLHGLGIQIDGDASGSLAIVQGKSPLGQIEAKFVSGETGQGHPHHGYIWRGIIAKGGMPVCHARCVPIGEGLESEIPEVVNCSARTGLDMLTKHYIDALGFNIVFFLPDSEDDFASYTEFLRYLGDKNRAGVAKFDDGTTLFLVPPSDFLTKILNISGPERLYGVVLKFPQHAPGSISEQPHSQLLQSQFINRQKIPPLPTEYSVVPRKEERILQVDYSSVLQDDSMSLRKHRVLQGSHSLTAQPVTVDSATTSKAEVSLTMSKAEVSLTPELIAALTSLLPGKEKSSGLESTQPVLETSSLKPLFPPNASDRISLPQVYYDRQTSEQTGCQLQHLGAQFNSLAQCPQQFQTYSTISNTPGYLAEGVAGNSQNQDHGVNLPQHDAVTYRPLSNFAQSGQFSVSPQVSQQYQGETPQKGRGMVHGKHTSGSQGSSIYQEPTSPIALSDQAHDGNFPGSDTVILPATEKVVSELPNQVQQLQSVLYGAGQGKPDVDYNKNQRYQSTLQFAANLLLQLQQQQKTAQAGQEPGNH